MALPPMGPLQQAGLEPPPPAATSAPPTGMSMPGGLGALGVNPAVEAKSLYDRFSGNTPELLKSTDKSLAEYMEGLTNYAPDPSEKWLNFAANIAKPTKFGTLGEVVTNVAGGLEPIVGKENALKNQYKQLAAQMGYMSNEKRLEQAQSGQLKTLEMLTNMQSKMNGAFSNRPIKLGDGTWAQRDPATGAFIPLAVSQQAALSKDYDTYYKIGEKILKTTDPATLDAFANEQIANKAAMRQGNPTTLNPGTVQQQQVSLPGANVPGATPPPQGGNPAPITPPTAGISGPPAPMAEFTAVMDGYAKAKADGTLTPEVEQQVLAYVSKVRASADPDTAKQIDMQMKDIAVVAPTKEKPKFEMKYAPTQGAEKVQLEGYQKHYGKMSEQYQQASDQSNMALMAYQEMLEAMKAYKESGGNQGTIAPYIAKAQNFLQSAGIKLSDDKLKQLIAAQEIEKLNFEMGGAAAKSINQSRATQLEVTLGMKNNPGLAMYEPAAQKMMAYLMAKSNISRTQQDTFTDWRDKFPNVDPSQFTTYWNLYHDYPEIKDRFPPDKIAALAKDSGASPIEIIKGLRKRLGAPK